MSRRGGRPGRPAGHSSSTNGGGAGPSNPTAAAILTGGVRQAFHDPTGRVAEYSSAQDRCPQCKTDRFLNPKLRLLISPCYHRLCDACLDRIFSLGPAPCPECGTICRKNQFGTQTFADLGVEREVDVRRRLGKLFNKREEEFDDLKAYNDYLEEVEMITYNTINRIDVAATEARIAAYEAANRSSSLQNVRAALLESEAQRAREAKAKAAQVERAARRSALLATLAEQRNAVDLEVVDLMARGASAADLARLKEAARRKEEEAIAAADREDEALLHAAQQAAPSKVKPTPKLPTRAWQVESLWDFSGPLATLDDAAWAYACAPRYDDPWEPKLAAEEARELPDRMRAGGFELAEYWSRGLRSATDGLGLVPPGEW